MLRFGGGGNVIRRNLVAWSRSLLVHNARVKLRTRDGGGVDAVGKVRAFGSFNASLGSGARMGSDLGVVASAAIGQGRAPLKCTPARAIPLSPATA
jgi:hypothetical protein